MTQEPNWEELSAQQLKNTVRYKNLQQLYKITYDQYEAMNTAQAGKCATCKLPPHDKYGSSDGLKLSVDLNKKTGVVRGLLCRSCKTALSHIKENADTARAIAAYLDTPTQ